MSSFLCFVCHSTVNADTNEETRDKYREVIGMHLCPDSHLCYICCYFLNKMCMFKSICLKRSLEYPVLFSEKGTINLQRSDIQVAILCPEDICLQHLNTRYHFYNNSENSQSDYGDNSYCQLQDENIKNTFNCELQNDSLKTNDFCCQMQENSSKRSDFHCQMQENGLKMNNFHYKMQDDSLKMNDFNYKMQDVSLKTNFNCGMQDGSLKSRFHCQYENYGLQNTNISYHEDGNLKSYHCQMKDDNRKSSFHCKLQDDMNNTSFNCQIQEKNLKNTSHCNLEDENIKNTDFYSHNHDENLKTRNLHYLQSESLNKTKNNCHLQQGNTKNKDFHCQLIDEGLKSYNLNCQMQENCFKDTTKLQNKMEVEHFKTNIHCQNDNLKNNIFKENQKTNEYNKNYSIENHLKVTDIQNYDLDKEVELSNQIFTKDKNNYENDTETQNINKQKEPIVLELNKMEIELDIPLSEDTNQESENERENSLYESDSDSKIQSVSDSDSKNQSMSDSDSKNQSTSDTDPKNQVTTQIEGIKKKKEFTRIKLSVKEQKKELEDYRKEEKYVTASYKCYNCAISFHFKDSYQAHMMRHEESNGEHSCTICSLRFANPAVLRSHARNHTERFKCTQCKAIVRARQRMTHKRICSGLENDSNTVYCDLCNAGFIGVSHLQQHMKRYHQAKNSNRTYLCNICGKSYNNQAAVRTHMITHINRKFSCDQCTATFSSPYTLNQHKKKHNMSDQELHYCTSCKIGYTTRKSLLAHLRNSLAHKDNVYKCPLCPRVCPSVKALQSHTDAIHARTNHLSCDICPAKYSTRKALIRHLRNHKGKSRKPTTLCHACGENFKSSSILKRHLKNVCEKDKIEELFYEQL